MDLRQVGEGRGVDPVDLAALHLELSSAAATQIHRLRRSTTASRVVGVAAVLTAVAALPLVHWNTSTVHRVWRMRNPVTSRNCWHAAVVLCVASAAVTLVLASPWCGFGSWYDSGLRRLERMDRCGWDCLVLRQRLLMAQAPEAAEEEWRRLLAERDELLR